MENRDELKDLVSDKNKWYHVTQLKQFQFDPTVTDLTNIARRDNLKFVVYKTISFKGDLRKVSSLAFLVKGVMRHTTHMNLGKSLRTTRNYTICILTSKNLKNLIPRK